MLDASIPYLLNEPELIQQLKQGNENAFRWLVENYRNRIYSTVFNILQSAEEAEDAVQETFIQVFEAISNFKEASSLSTWVYKIAVRKALDKMRRSKAKQKLHKLLYWWMPDEKKSTDSTFYHPGILIENKEKAAILFSAIKLLPEQQQLAFTLIKVQGMNYEETSEILQKSVKAVESLVSRANINLQKQLESYYNTSK